MPTKNRRPKKAQPTAPVLSVPVEPPAEVEAPPTSARPRTEGQRLLLALADSHSDVARRIGVTRQAVHAWRSGVNARPDDAQRARLEAEYQIPAESWSRGAEQPAPPKPDLDDDDAPRSKLEECDRLIALLRKAQRGAAKRELAQLVAEESKQLERRDRIERDLREGRAITEHPMYQKVLAVVERVCERAQHPAAQAALRELADALETLGGSAA